MKALKTLLGIVVLLGTAATVGACASASDPQGSATRTLSTDAIDVAEGRMTVTGTWDSQAHKGSFVFVATVGSTQKSFSTTLEYPFKMAQVATAAFTSSLDAAFMSHVAEAVHMPGRTTPQELQLAESVLLAPQTNPVSEGPQGQGLTTSGSCASSVWSLGCCGACGLTCWGSCNAWNCAQALCGVD
jgi:hypothetical protein